MAAPRLHLTPSDGDLFWRTLSDWRNWGWSRPLNEAQQIYMEEVFEYTKRMYWTPDSNLFFTLAGPKPFIARFPPEFYELKELRVLNLSIDKESQFDPTGFTQLTHLRLEVSGFEEVPVYNVPSLTNYYVQGDEVRTVPAAISSMNLTLLDLSGSAIEKLPPEIGDMRLLSFLDLGGTNIRTLPKEMVNLTTLSLLNLHGSNIKRIPIVLMRAFYRTILAGQLSMWMDETPLFDEYSDSGVETNVPGNLSITPEFMAFLILQREDELARARAFIFVNEQLAAAATEEGEVGMPRRAPERVEDATRRRLAGGGVEAGAGAGAGAAGAPPPPPALVRDVQRRLLTDAFALGRRHKAMLEMF